MRLGYLLTVLCVFLVGCKVGPHYCRPHTCLPESFHEDQPCETFLVEDEDLVQWWTTFNDPFLNCLLEYAVAENFDYKISLEKVCQARAQYNMRVAQILPEVDAIADGMRFRNSQTFVETTFPGFPAYQSLYQGALDAVWQIDLFGKLRRSAASSYDLWEASVAEMRGVKITVISSVANTYMMICAYQAQEEIAREVVQADEEVLGIAKARFEAGLGGSLDIENATATLEADRAQWNAAQAQLKQEIYSLAVLLGDFPQNVMDDFHCVREVPQAEGKIPVGLPSDLLRRRPDIQSAERNLASATELIGAAVADLFPSFSLTGATGGLMGSPIQGASVGYSSTKLDELFTTASSTWGIGGFMVAPLLDFGKRRAAVEVQVALRNQAYYEYKKTVITALQETEQALQNYFHEEMRQQNLEKQLEANRKNLAMTIDLFKGGVADYRQVVASKKVWLGSLNRLIESRQALASDLIAVYNALGGDW